ncbi:MAG: SGNH/GDSL hydrolase family protein [Promethearchaeota archaeon]|jgi:hypothetical protein
MKIVPKDFKAITIIGLIFVAIGILFNEWTVAKLFSLDGSINHLSKKIIVWVFDVIAVLTGLILLKYKHLIKARGREIVFTVVTFIVFLFILEGGMRVFHSYKSRQDSRETDFSEQIGWKTKENWSWTRRDEGYEVVFSTTKYGFRVFGDPNTNKFKIFVLGDSYTHGTTVSDGYTYYDYLRKNHENIEIFAFGTGGYGSLQEYMILDKYFDIIQPDLILWQFMSNDIINNSYKLESLSYLNNSHNTRPYYNRINGQITLLYPRQDFGWIYKVVQHSHLLKLLNIRLDILKVEQGDTIENYLKKDDPLAVETVETTSAIMGLVRKRVGSIPIVAFPVDKEQIPWSSDAFNNISQKYSIHYIDHLPDVLEEAVAKGIKIDTPSNPHWSDVGSAIVGKTILNYLIENNLLEK